MTRIHYIDIMKGIGILFVILGHMQKLISSSILLLIYSFHIPLFYFISGMVYKERYDEYDKLEYVKKIGGSLLYPYLTLFVINMFYGLIKEGIVKFPKYVLSFLYSNFIFDSNYVGAIWFLCSLFVVEFMFFLIHNSNNKKIMMFSTVIFGIFMKLVVTIYGFRFPLWLDVSFYGLIFYYMGYKLKKFDFKYYHIICLVIIYVLSIYLNVNYFGEYLINNHSDLLYLRIGCSIIYIVSAISAIIIILFMCKKVKRCLLIEEFGKNSLIIMGIHIIILQITTKMVGYLQLGNMINILIIFIFTAVISLLCSKMINKHFNFLIKIDDRRQLNGKT